MDLSALLALAALAPGVTVKIESYQGWDDAFHIANGEVELVVVPKIGRIMRYAKPGGPNALWENPKLLGKEGDPKSTEWQNFGGDKLWNAPQEMWGWPPPFELDCGPYIGTQTPDGVKLVGPTNPRFGIRFEREISLAKTGTEVRILNRLVNDTKYSMRRAIWQIAQVDDPSEVVAGLRVTKAWPDGFWPYSAGPLDPAFHRVEGKLLKLRRNPAASRKFGFAAPDGALSARVKAGGFRMSTPYRNRAPYPDEGSAQQVFLNLDPEAYVELELNAPMEWIAPGGQQELVVKWRLDP